MTKNEFITYVYQNNLVQRWAHKQLRMIPPNIREDIISEVYLLLMEIDDGKFNEIAAQGFKHLTAFARQFVINSLTPTGKTRTIVNLFSREILDETLFENNLNEDDYEE